MAYTLHKRDKDYIEEEEKRSVNIFAEEFPSVVLGTYAITSFAPVIVC